MLFVKSSTMTKLLKQVLSKQDFKMKNNIIIFSIFFITFLSLLTLVNADVTKLFCLTNSQEIRFSECNPNMNDFICGGTNCQICVTELDSGVYCPASLNACNTNEIGGCEPFIENIEGNENSDQENNENNNEENNQNNNEDPNIIINLISPIDNYESEENVELEFTFSITQSSTIEECRLYLDNTLAASIFQIQSTDKINYTPWIGTYNWEIECETTDGTIIVRSNPRSLSVIAIDNNSDNSGDNTNSGDNSNSDNSNSDNSSNTDSSDSSNSNNDANSGSNNIVSSNSNNNEDGELTFGIGNSEFLKEEQEKTLPITGSVIGINNGNFLFALIFIIILISIETTFYYLQKKQLEKHFYMH